jgi:hypothetical protein
MLHPFPLLAFRQVASNKSIAACKYVRLAAADALIHTVFAHVENGTFSARLRAIRAISRGRFASEAEKRQFWARAAGGTYQILMELGSAATNRWSATKHTSHDFCCAADTRVTLP